MKDLFHSAALKLTAGYLAIIMALSIGLSLVIYHFSHNELVNNTRRQVYFFNDELTQTDFNSFSQLRQRQLNQGIRNLRGNLLTFNVLVLAGGGLVSYGLARRSLRPIEEVMEAQKRFTGDASHELRTPLAAMQAEIEVALRDKGLTKAQAAKLLKSNLEEVGKLRSLSEGLLKLASENSQTIKLESVSLAAVVAEAVKRHSKSTGQKKIELKQEIKDAKVVGDHQSLTELVNLLLDNAVKYSPAGTTISISSGKHAKTAFIKITDQGQGIKASDLPHIFDRFFRADSSRNKSKANGYGLGLAIAHKIVVLHNGSIDVKSAPGKGSAFTVLLPSA